MHSGTTTLAAVVLLSDQFAVPAKGGNWSEQRVQLGRSLTSQLFGFHRQTPTLVIGQSQTFIAQLIAKNPLLFLQIRDAIALVLLDPAGEANQHEPKWGEALHGGTNYHAFVPQANDDTHLRARCSLKSAKHLAHGRVLGL